MFAADVPPTPSCSTDPDVLHLHLAASPSGLQNTNVLAQRLFLLLYVCAVTHATVSSARAGNAGLCDSMNNSNPDLAFYFLSLCKHRLAQVDEEGRIISLLLMDLDIFLFY